MFSPSDLSDHPSTSNHLYTILPSPSDHVEMSVHLPIICTSLSDCQSLPDHLYNKSKSALACPSPSDHLTETMTHLSTHLSSYMIQHTHDSSQSLADMNGEQSSKVKNFHRAFSNYNLLLCTQDVSSIYMSVSRHIAPPKSGEDAHITCGMCDLSGPTLY